MRIGIDIDDTLTNIKNRLTLALNKYAKSLNKPILPIKNKEDAKNDGSIYKEKYNFSYAELKHFLGPIQESITNTARPRKSVVRIIKQLKKDGHEIYIITARDYEFHLDPFKDSKIWLDNNGIIYDKLIVNARNKADICRKENIDLYIDDQLQNCLNIANAGIKAIRISKEETPDIPTFNNWISIYKYIDDINKK